ncbi:MAG: DNA-binding response regulator [Planctomycetia bacterium]|nr:DNA-binding response regulator [Planctomycetia bacterium]
MVEVLVHAATSAGVDRVVVAHPEAHVQQELATDVSRFGYVPVRVSTGREAIFAARGSADTVLVIIAARLGGPSALETVQFLRQQGLGAAPPVLVVVDPLDDDGRGCFLTQLLLKFRGVEGVTIVDRLDSFFQPVVDAASGATLVPARFPDALVQAAGPRAVDPASRVDRAEARLARARRALELLGDLGRRGWDVSGAAEAALAGLSLEPLATPAAAVLATIGRPAAQQVLAAEAERADLPPERRRQLLEAFAASTTRHGILLDSRRMLAAYKRYNRATADSRVPVADVLEVIETPSRALRSRPADAAPNRSTR